MITGTRIKSSDITYLGYFYSEKESEWLFLEYQNVPVRQDGSYVINDNDTRYAIYSNGEGKAPAKGIRKEVTNEVEVLADNYVSRQFTVPLRKDYQRSG